MWERVRHMMKKELIQVLRDVRMRMVVFVLPVIQLLIFGNAMNTDVEHVPMAILDRDQTVMSRELVDRFRHSRYFEEVARLTNEQQMVDLLDTGDVQMVLSIPPGFEGDIRAGRSAPLQVVLDGTDSNTTSIALGYCNAVVTGFSGDVLLERVNRSMGAMPPVPGIDLRSRAWFNENLESADYFVPGIMAILVTIVTLILTSMAVVREKEIGTMEQLIVTPITPAEFMLGKTLPFGLIGFIDVAVVTVAAMVGFGVPFRGNVAILALGTALYLMSTMGIGLLISTISETQQQAMMGTFFFMLPSVLLSGLMFPIANMPEVVQWLTYVNPMRYFLVIIRFVFQKGVGLSVLIPQMGALLVMGIGFLWLATKRFKKTQV